MRKPFALVCTTIVLAAAAACGGGGDDADTAAGQSGARPATVEATTTTSTTEPEADEDGGTVVEIPDVSDLGLTWDEEPVVDEETGGLNLTAFNRALVEATDLTALVPVDGLPVDDEDALDEALDDAIAGAPAKAVALYLGLQPGEAGTELSVDEVSDGVWQVTVVRLLEDDSIRAERWEFNVQVDNRADRLPGEEAPAEGDGAEGEGTDGEAAEGAPDTTTTTEPESTVPDLVPVLYSGQRTLQCQPDRGHQDFTPEPCT